MPMRLGRIEALDDPEPTLSELTSDERARLEKFSTHEGWRDTISSAAGAAGCMGMGAFFILAIGWSLFVSRTASHEHQYYFIGAGAVVAFATLISILRSDLPWLKLAKERASNLRRDAAEGIACDLDLDIKRVVEIEEYEDEGAGFFLELPDGRVLCLISQDLYEYATDIDIEEGEEDMRGQFPQTRIRYRYAPRSGFCLDLTGIGETLRPFGKVRTTGRFFKKDKKTGVRSYTGPEDGTIYEGPLEATLASFKYKLQPL